MLQLIRIKKQFKLMIEPMIKCHDDTKCCIYIKNLLAHHNPTMLTNQIALDYLLMMMTQHARTITPHSLLSLILVILLLFYENTLCCDQLVLKNPTISILVVTFA